MSRAKISLVAVDRDWQYPAITEKHAFNKVRELCPYANDVVYFAFPWATLIDLLDNRPSSAVELLEELKKSSKDLLRYKVVITVCQHIRMLEHKKYFDEAGVTDIFWSHAVCGQSDFGAGSEIKIHPFPLYPTQICKDEISFKERKYLYSFVGARANQWYLTNSRDLILDNLAEEDGAYVKGRDSWHYNNVVYGKQVHGREQDKTELMDKEQKTQEFLEIMQNTQYSLCPSGSGPNSIRLWESIEMGVIPVVLADTYLNPGDAKLWDSAVVTCKEDCESISHLPERLRVDLNSGVYHSRLRAVSQLKLLYGRECFVYDIIQFVTSRSSVPKHSVLFDMLEKYKEGRDDLANIILTSLNSALMMGKISEKGFPESLGLSSQQYRHIIESSSRVVQSIHLGLLSD